MCVYIRMMPGAFRTHQSNRVRATDAVDVTAYVLWNKGCLVPDAPKLARVIMNTAVFIIARANFLIWLQSYPRCVHTPRVLFYSVSHAPLPVDHYHPRRTTMRTIRFVLYVAATAAASNFTRVAVRGIEEEGGDGIGIHPCYWIAASRRKRSN